MPSRRVAATPALSSERSTAVEAMPLTTRSARLPESSLFGAAGSSPTEKLDFVLSPGRIDHVPRAIISAKGRTLVRLREAMVIERGQGGHRPVDVVFAHWLATL